MVQVQLAYSHKRKKKRKVLIAKCTSFFHSCIWESSKWKDGKAEAPGSEAEISEVMKASVEKWENYFHRSRLWNKFIFFMEALASVFTSRPRNSNSDTIFIYWAL